MKTINAAATQVKRDVNRTRDELLEKAWVVLGQDLFSEALEAFTSALGPDPVNSKDATCAEALYGQALCLRKLHKPDEARKRLEVLAMIEPGYSRFFVKEALLYIDKERYDEAIEQFSGAEDSEARNMLRQLIVSLRTLRPSVIENVIEAALKVFPGDPGIRSEYGWLRYLDEHYDEAIEKFDDVLGDEKYEDLKAKTFRGYESAIQGKIASLRRKRQFTQARALLEDPLVLLPTHYGIQSELGWLYSDQKLFDEALRVFTEIYQQGDKSALQWIITCLRSQRDFAEAEKWIQKALQELNDASAWIGIQNEKGWLCVDRKRYPEAINTFNQVLEKDERNQFALQGKIACLRLQGRFQEAEELAGKALDWHPESTGILSERGWLFFDQRHFSEAEASFAKAITIAPYQIDLEFSRVEVLNRLNRSFEAEKIFEELRRKFPDDEAAIVERLGRFYIQQKDLKKAEDQFRSIHKNDPNKVGGLSGLGAVCLLEARYDEAIEHFRKLVSIDGNNPAWFTNLAWALVRDEEANRDRQPAPKGLFGAHTQDNALSPLDEAEKCCQKALELDPESPDAYGCLGTIAFRRGKLRFCEDYLRVSIEKDLLRGNYVGLGALYVQMGRYDDAEELLLRGIHDQDDVPAHVELGNLYLKTGKIKEAIQEFRRAMAIDPGDEAPPRALSIALMEANELNEAEAVLRDGLRRLDESKRWRLHLTRAQLLTKRGDETESTHYYDEAFKEAKKTIQLKPDYADPYFQAGFIRAKLKDYKGARKYFRECLKRNTDHDEAESNLSSVESLIREEKERSRSSFWAGFCVGALAVSQLILLWYFFKQGKVTETILSVLLPILLGLVVVAFLIPVLYKLKLPGLEAELRERKDNVSAPKGEIVFSTSPPTISSGPR
ncbi:MAG TPA: tetratricopeptide repeat protein [Pyrinomonadaceae bacterium]|nr:tetratricopeptide repeat protein [Pyrinomonadaceae bacterium]